MNNAGVPVMRAEAGHAELRTEDHITLDRRLVPADDAFLMRATREAAPAHGVRLGDLVLVHPSSRAKDGDVVIVRAANAVVVRAMSRRGATLHLAAPGQGEDFELGQGDDYVVLGVLAGVFRTADGGRQMADGSDGKPDRSSDSK